MTNFRAHELLEYWLQHYMLENLKKDNPNFQWISENLEAYNLITKALWAYDNPEKEINESEEDLEEDYSS